MTVRDIARKTKEYEDAKDELLSLREELDKAPLAIACEEKSRELSGIDEELSQLKAQYRENGIEIYNEIGTTKFEGGDVRIRKSYDYDNNLAREWIIEHNHLELFKIDKTKFLKVAKAVELPLLEITENPTFYLKTDLSEFLNE